MSEDKNVIKILAVISSPVVEHGDASKRPIPPIAIEEEWAGLVEAVKDLPVQLGRCYPPTLNRMEEMLRNAAGTVQNAPYDIVHFSGHGKPLELLFGNGDLYGVYHTAQEVGDIFKEAKVKLAILSACYSGYEKPGSGLISPAEALANAYVPAVIATTDSVEVGAATFYAVKFLNSLCNGYSVENSHQYACAQMTKEQKVSDYDATLFKLFGQGDVGLNENSCEPKIASGLPPQFGSSLFHNDYFFGREVELAEISALLGAGNDRIITITGIGGSGKTTLAKELARRNAWRYPGGLVWADFRKGAGAGPGVLLEAIIEQLGINVQDKANPEPEVMARLHAAACLVVCDNIETVAFAARSENISEADKAAANALIELISNLPPTVQVLCTGREPLGTKKEQKKHIIGLESVAAIQYFLEIARDNERVVEITEDDDKVGELINVVNAVSRIPLAVYLAASAYADTSLSLKELREGLEQKSTEVLVDEDMAGEDAERHKSITASIQYSCEMLKEESAKQLFPKLGIFSTASGFDEQAIEKVCDVADWEKGLSELVRKSLVERSKLEGITLGGGKEYFRYKLFPPVAEYALNTIKGGKDLEEKFADFYFAMGFSAKLIITKNENVRYGMSIINLEEGNVTSALDLAYENDRADWISSFVDILETFYHGKFAYDELEFMLKRSMEYDIKSGRRYAVAVNYHRLGILATERFHYDEAMGYYEQSKEITEEIGDNKLLAMILHQMGTAAIGHGHYDTAMDYYRLSKETEEELGNKKGVAESLHHMGIVAHLRNDSVKAMGYYGQAIKVFDEIDDYRGKGAVLHQMGMSYYKQGLYSKAKEYYSKGLGVFVEIGADYEIAGALHELGLTSSAQNEYEEAMDYYQKSLEIKNKIGDKQGIARSRWVIGDTFKALSKPAEAIIHYLQALYLAREIDFKDAMVGILHTLYELRNDVGNDNDFVKHFDAAAQKLEMSEEDAKEALEYIYAAFKHFDENPPDNES